MGMKEDRTSKLVVRGHHLPEVINEIVRSEVIEKVYQS